MIDMDSAVLVNVTISAQSGRPYKYRLDSQGPLMYRGNVDHWCNLQPATARKFIEDAERASKAPPEYKTKNWDEMLQRVMNASIDCESDLCEMLVSRIPGWAYCRRALLLHACTIVSPADSCHIV